MTVGWSADAGGGQAPLAELWDGTSWTLLHPLGRHAPQVSLTSVACPSATACMAVGSYGHETPSGGRFSPLSETWNGRTWTMRAVPASRRSRGRRPQLIRQPRHQRAMRHHGGRRRQRRLDAARPADRSQHPHPAHTHHCCPLISGGQDTIWPSELHILARADGRTRIHTGQPHGWPASTTGVGWGPERSRPRGDGDRGGH